MVGRKRDSGGNRKSGPSKEDVQRGQAVPLLERDHGRDILGPVDFRSNDAVNEAAFALEDGLRVAWLGSVPFRASDQIAAGLGARCAGSNVVEVVREHVDELHGVVAILDLWDGDDEGLCSQVEPGEGIHRVVVRTNDVFEVGSE